MSDLRLRRRCNACRRRFIVWSEAPSYPDRCVECSKLVGLGRGLFGRAWDRDPGQVVVISAGAGVGQARRVIDFDPTTRSGSVEGDWASPPDETSTFLIL